MASAGQVSAVRPGIWQMPEDRNPYRERQRDPAAASRFAAAMAEAVARQEGPGRAWTDIPAPAVAAIAAPAPRMHQQQLQAYRDVLAFTAPLARN